MNNTNDHVLVDLKMQMAVDPELLFYTSVLYGLELEFGETKFNTAQVEGTKITFTEDFLMEIVPDERLGLLLHEVRHITDLHEFRRAERDPKVWNAACDFVINGDIIASGYKLPKLEHACYDKKYANMAAEEIYEDLIQNQPNAAPMIADVNGDGSGDSAEPGSEGGSGSQPQTGTGDSPEDEIKDLLIQAVQIAQQGSESAAGNIPAHILRMVNEWLNPVVPWQNILQRYMSQKSKEDYSWQRPSRRYIAHKLYVPSLYSEQLGPIHFFIDGSCSVSDKMFDMQVGQIKWIKHNLNPKEIRIIVFNTKIIDEFIFDEHTPIDVAFKARGGTAIGEVVTYMEENKCECNIVLTDGYFTWVDCSKVPDDLLWLIYNNPPFKAPQGETITLPKEK